ncbi:MAG: ABC transporter transmembrane domain-containing protein, partial [Desulfopila sp.]
MPSVHVHAKVVEKPLWKWIFAQNTWLQFALVFVAALAALANLLPLEMQKRIVNEAIEESRLSLLINYCGIYLAAVVSATLLKYLISILQTVIGQKTTERMRDSLYRHLLIMPLGFYRKTQPGLIVSALTTELATAGDFIGMAVAVPATNLLMLAAFAGYLLWLNPLLALSSFIIYPIILLVVPVLQKQVNRYNRKRIDATRKISSKAGETVEGIHEIHTNNTFVSEGDDFAHLVKDLRAIRIIWNLYRQGIKRVNSLFVNFSRFLVFAVGGYLAINGNLEIGVLVAFISAQDKLYDPWKEMISYYQAYKTAQVTYERTMKYFAAASVIQLDPDDRAPYSLKGNIVVEDLSFTTDADTQLLTNIDLKISHGEHLALVGFSGSGKSTLMKCIGQLSPYTGGKIILDGKEVSELSKADIAANIGFVSQEPFIFTGSIRENLLYGHLEKSRTEEKDSSTAAPEARELVEILEKT